MDGEKLLNLFSVFLVVLTTFLVAYLIVIALVMKEFYVIEKEKSKTVEEDTIQRLLIDREKEDNFNSESTEIVGGKIM